MRTTAVPICTRRPMGRACGYPDDSIYEGSAASRGTLGGAGISRLEMPIMAQVAMLGGDVEGRLDNFYRRGVFTNGELVERARAILDGLGYELATPKDARQILGLPA